MKLYRKKDFLWMLVCLSFALYALWQVTTGKQDGSSYFLYTILFSLLAILHFRQAFVKKFAIAAQIEEQDELETLRYLKIYQIAFWGSPFLLLLVGTLFERGNSPAAYAFFAAAGLLFLLKWLFTGLYSWKSYRQDELE